MKIHSSNIDKFIEHNQEYKHLIKRVEEASLKVEQFNSFKILDFIDQHQQRIIKDTMNHFSKAQYQLVSKIINSERKLLIIYTSEADLDNQEALTTLLKIKYPEKFNQIDHQDVLGSILNSKIERRLIGDIVTNDDGLFVEVSSSIKDYLINNVTKIKNSKASFVEVHEATERHDNFKTKIHIIKSNRLDVVVKALLKQSRNETKEYILQNNVKVNQLVTNNFSLPIADGAILSLKGYGRFLINFKKNRTKKDNIIMIEHKYR